MTEKEEIRNFSQIESRPPTIEKPLSIMTGTPAPLFEWLAKIIRRMEKSSKTAAQE